MPRPAIGELWVESRAGRPAVNPVMSCVLDELASAGHRMSVVIPETRAVSAPLFADRPAPDLVLLKSATSMALSAATVAEGTGVRVLNPAAASARVSDKAAALALVACAGIPVPVTFLTADSVHPTAPAQPGAIGWVSKPVNGVHGWGIGVHDTLIGALGATAAAPAPIGAIDDGSMLVQRRVGADDPDVKVYAVGTRVFAGVKAFGPGSHLRDDIVPVELTSAERDAAVAAGRACGLRIYGVDLRRDADGFRVIDVNAFPGFRGFVGAVPVLVAEIQRCLVGADP